MSKKLLGVRVQPWKSGLPQAEAASSDLSSVLESRSHHSTVKFPWCDCRRKPSLQLLFSSKLASSAGNWWVALSLAGLASYSPNSHRYLVIIHCCWRCLLSYQWCRLRWESRWSELGDWLAVVLRSWLHTARRLAIAFWKKPSSRRSAWWTGLRSAAY